MKLRKTNACLLVVALSLSGCAAMEAAHTAYVGASVLGSVLNKIKVPQEPAKKSPANETAAEADQHQGR